MKKTICLNMIVKNEAHVIKKTLTQLHSIFHFDYYAISDTGSTDGTQEIIKSFFEKEKVPGILSEDEWKDFGHNRSVSLKLAYNKTDYCLIFDADDSVCGNFIYEPEKLKLDQYNFTFGTIVKYKRPLLFNNRKRYKFVGILHEFLQCLDLPITHGDYEGDYYIDSGRLGDRSKNPNKYLDDAKKLEYAYEHNYYDEDIKLDLRSRYAFYCGQSYKDHGMKPEAIMWYKKVLVLNNWEQEKYYSCLNIGMMLSSAESIYYYLLGFEYDPLRFECLFYLFDYLINNNNFKTLNTMMKLFNVKNLLKVRFNDKLFVDAEIHNFRLYLLILNNSLVNKELIIDQSYYINTIIENMSTKTMNVHLYNLIINKLSSFMHLLTDDNIKGILDAIKINKGFQLRSNTHELMNILYNHTENSYKKFNIKNIKFSNDEQIVCTITTCKRYDLFEKTIKSFLLNVLDINKITHIYVIDDGSSEEDKLKMKTKFPFLKFIHKTPEQKGHRASMNIIYDLLKKGNYKYWFQMEDDWLYIRKDKYITKMHNILLKYKNQKYAQVLINQRYNETFGEYNSVGGKLIDNNLLLHIKDEEVNGCNSVYWPHFSFRPSLIDVSVILSLGNFDTPNSFFERDYADNYYAAGYKSVYFNEINSLHIGKLTHDKKTANAYTLNNEVQFSSDLNQSAASILQKNKFIVNLLQYNFPIINSFNYIESIKIHNFVLNTKIVEIFKDVNYDNNRMLVSSLAINYDLWNNFYRNKTYNYLLVINRDLLKESYYKDIETLFNESYNTNYNESDEQYIKYIKLDTEGYNYIISREAVGKLLSAAPYNNFYYNIMNELFIPEQTISYNYQTKHMDINIYDKLEFDVNVIKSHYTFNQGLDQNGNDYFYKLDSIENMFYAADSNKICGFNNLGFFKNAITELRETPHINKYSSSEHGIYIRKK